METMKETAATIGASAKSGMEKTKATVQGTVEKMSTKDPMMKDAAEMKKQDRIMQAEAQKQQDRWLWTHPTGQPAGQVVDGVAQSHPVATNTTGLPAGQVVDGVAQSHPIATNTTSQPAGQVVDGVAQSHPVATNTTGQPAGQVVDGVAQSHPIGTNTGTQMGSGAHNTHVGGGANGTGGSYT